MVRKRNWNGFVSGFASGAAIGRALAKDFQEAKTRADVAEASQQNAVTEQAGGEEVRANIEQNFVPQEGGPQTAAEFIQQTPGVADVVAGQKAGFSVGGKSYDEHGAAQIAARGLNMRAMADAYERNGRPEDAGRLQMQAMQLKQAERQERDSDELRTALTGGPTPRDAASLALRQSTATGPDITGASSMPEHKPPPAPSAMAGGADKSAPRFEYSFDEYLKKVAPGALQAMVKQGRLEEARRFSEFVESEEGRSYATKWIAGVRRNAVGDSLGALKEFEKLYNSQGFDDGLSVKMVPLDGGKRYRIDQYDGDGKLLGGREGTTDDLAHAAASALSPMSAVKYYVERDKAVAKESAIVAREDAREDRRDARLAARLNAQLERGGGAKGLTPAQERSNAEIDAARDAVAGLSPAEINKRTQKATDTGRPNEAYDPALARAVTLANRRKIGDDPHFDQRRQGQQPEQPAAPAVNRADVAKRFRSDRAMDGYTLGRDTPEGVEVLQKGRVVGHYR